MTKEQEVEEIVKEYVEFASHVSMKEVMDGTFGKASQKWLRTQLISLAEKAEERGEHNMIATSAGYAAGEKKGAQEMKEKAIACVPLERTENANPDVVLVVRAFNDCREQILTNLTSLSLTNE